MKSFRPKGIGGQAQAEGPLSLLFTQDGLDACDRTFSVAPVEAVINASLYTLGSAVSSLSEVSSAPAAVSSSSMDTGQQQAEGALSSNSLNALLKANPVSALDPVEQVMPPAVAFSTLTSVAASHQASTDKGTPAVLSMGDSPHAEVQRGAQRPAGVVGVAGLASAGEFDFDVLGAGRFDQGFDVLGVGREDRDGTEAAAVLGDRHDLRVDAGDLLAEDFFGLEAELAGASVDLDAAGDVDLDAGAAQPIDHPVDESVVFGLAGMALALDRARDVQRSDDLSVEEACVGTEQFVVAGQGGHRPSIQQEVAAFAACHVEEMPKSTSSLAYSSVQSTPWASSSSSSSLKAACWASTSRRSASSMKPNLVKPAGCAPLLEAPLLETSMLSSLGMPQIVAPASAPDKTLASTHTMGAQPAFGSTGQHRRCGRNDRIHPSRMMVQKRQGRAIAPAPPSPQLPPTIPVTSDTLREGSQSILERIVQGTMSQGTAVPQDAHAAGAQSSYLMVEPAVPVDHTTPLGAPYLTDSDALLMGVSASYSNCRFAVIGRFLNTAAPGDARSAEAARSGAPSITEIGPAVLNPRELDMLQSGADIEKHGQVAGSR
jgi:hypothetical protein